MTSITITGTDCAIHLPVPSPNERMKITNKSDGVLLVYGVLGNVVACAVRQKQTIRLIGTGRDWKLAKARAAISATV